MVAAACSTPTTPADDCAAAERNHATPKKAVISTLPIPDGAAAQLAIDKCYFAAEGIRAELKIIKNVGEAVPALKTGEITVSLGNYVTILQAEAAHPGTFAYIADAYQAGANQVVPLGEGGSRGGSPDRRRTGAYRPGVQRVGKITGRAGR